MIAMTDGNFGDAVQRCTPARTAGPSRAKACGFVALFEHHRADRQGDDDNQAERVSEAAYL